MSNYTDTQYQNDNFGFSQGYQHRNSQTFYPKDRSFQKRHDQNQKREDSQLYEEDQQYRYNQCYSNYAQSSPGYSDYSQQKPAANSKVYEYQAKNKQVNQDYGNFQQSGGVNKKLTFEQNDHNSITNNDFKDKQYHTPQKNSYSFENDDSHCLSSGSNDNLCDNLVMVNEQNGTTKFNRKKDQSSEDLYQHNSSNSSNKSNKSYQQFESQQNSCSPSSKSAAFYPSSPFQQFPMQQVFDQNSASSFDHNALKAQEWSPHKQNQNHKQQWQPSSQRQNQNNYNNKNSNGYFRYHGNPQIHQNVYKVKAKNSAVSEFKPYEQPKPVETPKIVPMPVVVQPLPDSKPAVRRMKYEMCKNFREKGSCKYNDRCLFAHGDHELTRRGSSEEKTEKSKDSSEKEAEDHAIAIVDEPKADEPTLDSTQLAISKTDLTQEGDKSESKIELSLKSDSKKHSAESKEYVVEFELRSDIGDNHSEIQDTGENSTTLSSANDQNTPESVSAKANMIGTPNIYCFKKEEEFKDLLQNLDIENIEIDLFNKNLPENSVQILALDQKDKQIDIEIEKLLSDEGDSDVPQKSQDYQGGEYELVQNLALNQFKRNSEIIIATNDLKETKSSVPKNDNELAILKLGSQNASKVMQRRLQIFEDITTQDNI